MELLNDDAVVYKMMGPVLVKQEASEAKQTVSKRLEYINKEMYAIERVNKVIIQSEVEGLSDGIKGCSRILHMCMQEKLICKNS